MSESELKIVSARIEDWKEEFSPYLKAARVLSRRYPTIVNSPEFPAQFADSYRNREGSDPNDDDCNYSDRELVAVGILPRPVEDAEN